MTRKESSNYTYCENTSEKLCNFAEGNSHGSVNRLEDDVDGLPDEKLD